MHGLYFDFLIYACRFKHKVESDDNGDDSPPEKKLKIVSPQGKGKTKIVRGPEVSGERNTGGDRNSYVKNIRAIKEETAKGEKKQNKHHIEKLMKVILLLNMHACIFEWMK